MKTVIDSKLSNSINLAEILKYKGLIQNLAKRDFLVRYKQAYIGIAWALLKPLINILVFGYIASKIISDVNVVNSYLNVAIAMVIWQLFSNVFNEVSNSIVGNSNLFSKVYFPKIVIPISSILVCLVDFFISSVIIIGLFIFSNTALHWQIIFAPFFIILTVINAFGFGLFFATLFVKYRDVRFVVPVIIQFGMYLSPVILSTNYYLDRIPNQLHWLFFLNPMAGAIEGFKYSLLGVTVISNPYFFVLSMLISFIFLILGIKYFYKFERNFVDYI